MVKSIQLRSNISRERMRVPPRESCENKRQKPRWRNNYCFWNNQNYISKGIEKDHLAVAECIILLAFPSSWCAGRGGNRKGIMIVIVIKQLLVFWDLFSLESLQFNKWAWHRHWAGRRLAHFPLVCLPRPPGSALSLKRSVHKLRSPTFRFTQEVLCLFPAWLVLPLPPSDDPALLSYVWPTLLGHLLCSVWSLLHRAHYASGTWRKRQSIPHCPQNSRGKCMQWYT